MSSNNISSKEYMLDPAHGADAIVQSLLGMLPAGATIFEYGAGKGRNALFLAKNWYDVTAQDLSEKNLSDMLEHVRTLNAQALGSPIGVRAIPAGDAVSHVLDRQYDAFLCIRVLHFLQPAVNAWSLIYKMQDHTKRGWYNAISFFTGQTAHKPECFFPDAQEVLDAYSGWEICEMPEILVAEPSETTNWRPMYQQAVLFKKP